MIEFFVVLLLMGSLWMAAILIGFAIKLVLGLVGGVFSLLGGLLALGVVLVMLPVMALVALPLLVPVLFVVGLAWLVAHAARRPPRVPAPAAR